MSIYRIQSTRANVSMDRALFSCTWPPPRLTGILQYGSSSPANQPSAPPIKYTPLYNASVLPLLPSGFPSGLVPPLPPTDNNSLVLALPFTWPLKCVARRASNTAQLMRAVIALQALSSQYVIMSINNNMTWNDTGTQTDWPTSELALRIYRNVTLQGRHVSVTWGTDTPSARQPCAIGLRMQVPCELGSLAARVGWQACVSCVLQSIPVLACTGWVHILAWRAVLCCAGVDITCN